MDNKGIELIKELIAILPDHNKYIKEKAENYLASLETQKITTIEAWDRIIGNEYVKRAMEVSLAGQYPITVIGDPDNGKDYLEIILGDLLTFVKPCPCGNFMDPNKSCTCTVSKLTKYTTSKTYQTAIKNPIIIQLQPPTSYDYRIIEARKATKTEYLQESFKDVLNRIEKVDPNKKLNEKIGDLLSTAIRRLNFTTKQVENIKNVANTIALLDGSDSIKDFHLAEAIQYQNINS